MSLPLSKLSPGQFAIIESITGSDAVTQRLLEFGLLEGETVEVVTLAPLGDPVEIRLGNQCLSLRISEADRIVVIPVTGSEK